MNTKEKNEIKEKILKGLELAHKKLIQTKKDRNFDLVISKNGKVVRINARDL
jgi:hypothetical protein